MTIEQKKPNGRPEKPIDWKKVDELLIAGCSGAEIASHFNLTPETLYERTAKEYNKGFSTYSQELRQKGDSLLRHKQFQKAMTGDNTMLIWLGKNRMGQKEHHENNVVPNDKSLELLINEIKSLKEIHASKPEADSKL
jgi:hypothetical protein